MSNTLLTRYLDILLEKELIKENKKWEELLFN